MFPVKEDKNEITMSSLDFLNNFVNPARKEMGENPTEYRHFLKRVEDELDDLGSGKIFFSEEINNLGFRVKREKKYYDLTYDQMLLVGMRESKSVRRSVLEKLKELTEKTVTSTKSLNTDLQFNRSLALADAAAQMLNLSESSKLKMLGNVSKAFDLPSGILPDYSIDASAVSVSGSSDATASLSKLLKDFGSELTPVKANKKLSDLGLIVSMERPSTKGTTKKFWNITEKGLVFGKNITSPANPRETQPHYYVHKFEELLTLIDTE